MKKTAKELEVEIEELRGEFDRIKNSLILVNRGMIVTQDVLIRLMETLNEERENNSTNRLT